MAENRSKTEMLSFQLTTGDYKNFIRKNKIKITKDLTNVFLQDGRLSFSFNRLRFEKKKFQKNQQKNSIIKMKN